MGPPSAGGGGPGRWETPGLEGTGGVLEGGGEIWGELEGLRRLGRFKG